MRRRKYMVIGLTVLLASCTGTTPAPKAAPSIENFTTDGKPTKTVQTPWGDKQVYDPTQDAEVIAAYKYVEKVHKKLGTSNTNEQLKPYKQWFAKIRRTQLHDMARLGCRIPIYPGCGEGVFENTISLNCNINLGQSELNNCESQNLIQSNFDLVRAQDSPVCYADFKHIGSPKREPLKSSNINDFFKSGCTEFIKKE